MSETNNEDKLFSIIEAACNEMYKICNNKAQMILPCEYKKDNKKMKFKYEDKDGHRYMRGSQKNNHRLSEQELKQAFIKHITCEYKFSVETPTVNLYRFSENDNIDEKCVKTITIIPVEESKCEACVSVDESDSVTSEKTDANLDKNVYTSARIDVTLYDNRARILHHIEFKAHNPDIKNIAKDFLKLLHEPSHIGYTHYFLHVVRSFDKYTRLSLIAKFIKSLELLKDFNKKDRNNIYIYVFDTSNNELYRFCTNQLSKDVSKSKDLIRIAKDLTRISKDNNTEKFNYDEHTILYEISRLRNNKNSDVNNEIVDLMKKIKAGNLIAESLSITEKYWEEHKDKSYHSLYCKETM